MATHLSSQLNRFFFKFSYIGTRFSGVAKQINTDLTVYNIIEKYINTLEHVCSLNSKITISSRTDARVHAISNTGHFDLVLNEEFLKNKFGGSSLQNKSKICSFLKDSLNELLISNKYFIRILDIENMSLEFSSRNVNSRTYVYRLALLENSKVYWDELERMKKVECFLEETENQPADYSRLNRLFPLANFTNVFERDLVSELKEPFNLDLFLKAIDIYNGEHDFSAFTTKFGRNQMIKNNKNPIKNVKISVKNSLQFLNNHLEHINDHKYDIIEVEINAESFLYKMIRKMMGVAKEVASGKIPITEIKRMLHNPSDYYELEHLILSPNGLFLKSVNYDKLYLENKKIS